MPKMRQVCNMARGSDSPCEEFVRSGLDSGGLAGHTPPNHSSDAPFLIERWRQDYNDARPHTYLGWPHPNREGQTAPRRGTARPMFPDLRPNFGAAPKWVGGPLKGEYLNVGPSALYGTTWTVTLSVTVCAPRVAWTRKTTGPR